MRTFIKNPYVLMVSAVLAVWTNANAQQRRNADYLILSDPKMNVGANAEYKKLYEGKLFVTPGNLARFVQLPGPLAQTEIAVSLYEQNNGSHKYFVTLTEPSRRLADCEPIDPALPRVDPNTIQVRRFNAQLPEPTALALHSVWVTMLKQARPDPCKDCSGEGTTEIFSALMPNGRTVEAAMIYSGPNTLELAKLAGDLIEYCRAPATERDGIARNLEKKAVELQKRSSLK